MLKTSEVTFAFKEWACVVRALGTGEQILILRKGGIHEQGKKFSVEHENFFLFPTYEHQKAEDLNARGQQLLEELISVSFPGMTGESMDPRFRGDDKTHSIPIEFFAEVRESLWIEDREKLSRLSDFHIWSERALAKRYDWSDIKGLYALLVRVYRLPQTCSIENRPAYGGCRSWVDLGISFPLGGMFPVLSDREFEDRAAAIRLRLT